MSDLLKYARDREAVIAYNRERVLRDNADALDEEGEAGIPRLLANDSEYDRLYADLVEGNAMTMPMLPKGKDNGDGTNTKIDDLYGPVASRS